MTASSDFFRKARPLRGKQVTVALRCPQPTFRTDAFAPSETNANLKNAIPPTKNGLRKILSPLNF